MRIQFASCSDYTEYHPDDAILAAELESRGHECELVQWRSHTPQSGDCILIRTTWDYYANFAEFSAWLDAIDAAGAKVLNSTEIIRWNADKQYLIDLDTHGHDVISTAVLDNVGQLHGVVLSCGTEECVVKPTRSANAFQTLRFPAQEIEEAQNVAQSIIDTGALPMVQPFLPEVTSEGEWSLIGFGGEYSHAVLKTPKAGDFRVQHDYGGTVSAQEPPPQAMAAAQRLFDSLKLPYMRVDGVVHWGQFLLMELELIEPELFLRFAPGSEARFADELERAFNGEEYGAPLRRNPDC